MTEQHAPEQVVARLYELFGEGRIEETFALMHPDVVIDEPGDPERLPWAGRFVGHEGLRRFYTALSESLSEIRIDPSSLTITSLPSGQVLALGTEHGVSAATGRRYVSRSAWVWTVAHSRIVALDAYHDTASMVSAMTP